MQAIALRALLKRNMKPSPCAFTSDPPCRTTIRRTMVLWVSMTRVQLASPSSTARDVEFSLSENTNVTVPTSVSVGGRSDSAITAAATTSIDVARGSGVGELGPAVSRTRSAGSGSAIVPDLEGRDDRHQQVLSARHFDRDDRSSPDLLGIICHTTMFPNCGCK